MEFVTLLALMLFLTLVVSHIFNKLNLPAVVGQLILGVILGKGILNIVHSDSKVELFADIGVILLMFLAGLESNLALLRKHLLPSINVAIFGVILPVFLTLGTALIFGITPKESIFMSVVFAATSVSISVEVLKGLNYLSSTAGTVILGAAVADDIMAISILSVMSGTLTGNFSFQKILLLLGLWIFFGILVVVFHKWVIPELMKLSEYLEATHAPTIFALVICFIMAYIAEKVQLDSVLGAFVAGIAVSNSKDYDSKISRNIELIGYSIFIPIFFISIGLNLEFNNFLRDFWLIALFTITGIVGKLFGAGFGARISGFNFKDSYVIGSGMISRGEMALIVAQVGYSVHLLSEEYYSTVIISIILITIIAPFFLKHSINKNPL
ncbi:sodium:proton antiporter [Companilactobacillus crustorum]|uniref:Na(+) H(+) antiporter n=3 Tax=Companilactobacillus TaxID=2767879 RepID=A0A837RK41_9LACO|nr:cation:proton antiporter [Companilactobacillus crustorum]HCD07449.1 cation:proton antiporter [Lactobacillus sp.]APU70386.1 Na(+)/H(+) antiporter [Companilactobacillus crustorum]KRK43484.1 Na(+) H(+) antiporter [Companilactobacillus crustorum JCM 15951]KRO21005.1 Na(+) H(+) antiporter [Companilactobacillus crustorum]WDT65434.1 cation:proton antiporter [Companilactobacillus crustorum]